MHYSSQSHAPMQDEVKVAVLAESLPTKPSIQPDVLLALAAMAIISLLISSLG